MADCEADSVAESRYDSELICWINEFQKQLDDPKHYKQVYETLKANGFTSRLKLKLIREDELNIMFTDQVLPLGAKTLLAYQLNLLREESPLVSKSRFRNTTGRMEPEKGENSKAPKKVSNLLFKYLMLVHFVALAVCFIFNLYIPQQNVVRALQHQEEKLNLQVIKEKDELKEIDFNIDSMNVNIREQAAIGSGKTVCGHCHHRGHRNQPTKPCMLKRCTEYTYCGIKDKHPEYFSKLNSLKLERRKKENTISEIENKINSMQQFSSSSEFQFVKNLTPRMYEVDITYKTNKAKLMRDVRLLRECLDGKIPPITTNDTEQLGLLIAKFKKTKGVKADNNAELFQDITQDSNIDLSPVKGKVGFEESVESKRLF